MSRDPGVSAGHSDRYAILDVPGRRYRLAAWEGEGAPVPIAMIRDPSSDPVSALVAAADAHRRQSRLLLARSAAGRAVEDVVGYLRSLPSGDRPWALDMSAEDPDDMEILRGDVLRHLTDAASETDPFRAAVSFERGMCGFRGDVRLVFLLRDILLEPLRSPDAAEAAGAAREAATAMRRGLERSSGMVRSDVARAAPSPVEAPPPPVPAGRRAVTELPEDYFQALTLLGAAFGPYRRRGRSRPVIVGGAAVSWHTQGTVLSGDFDVVADIDLEPDLLDRGFVREARAGRLHVGYHHPAVPRLGFQLVSGALYDGQSEPNRLLEAPVGGGEAVTFPCVEDLVADRLGQFAASGDLDPSMFLQARLMAALAPRLDVAYLVRRVRQDTGEPSLLGSLEDRDFEGDLPGAIAARKALLGIGGKHYMAALNGGMRRTPEKRELLRRMDARAAAAGLTPLPRPR